MQFAKAAGAMAITMMSSAKKVEVLKKLGAGMQLLGENPALPMLLEDKMLTGLDHIINYRGASNLGERAKDLTPKRVYRTSLKSADL